MTEAFWDGAGQQEEVCFEADARGIDVSDPVHVRRSARAEPPLQP